MTAADHHPELCGLSDLCPGCVTERSRIDRRLAARHRLRATRRARPRWAVAMRVLVLLLRQLRRLRADVRALSAAVADLRRSRRSG
jgi:hypothetical protein